MCSTPGGNSPLLSGEPAAGQTGSSCCYETRCSGLAGHAGGQYAEGRVNVSLIHQCKCDVCHHIYVHVHVHLYTYNTRIYVSSVHHVCIIGTCPEVNISTSLRNGNKAENVGVAWAEFMTTSIT